MGIRHRLNPTGATWLKALAIAGAFAAVACKKPVAEEAPVPAAPVDHLTPGDQPLGKEKAFTLPLPLAASVASRFGDTVHVVSPLTPEELTAFVRIHTREAPQKKAKAAPAMVADAGAKSAQLDDVVAVEDKSRHLYISIRPAGLVDGNRSEMFVRDGTPPPAEPGLTEAERWKRAGLTPDGKLLDPKHME